MKNLVFIVLVALFGLTATAQEKKNKNAKHDIEVRGNCDMCKNVLRKLLLG